MGATMDEGSVWSKAVAASATVRVRLPAASSVVVRMLVPTAPIDKAASRPKNDASCAGRSMKLATRCTRQGSEAERGNSGVAVPWAALPVPRF
ncbi:MAG: hypothetical protein JWR21_1913 [Herminiimonas sp.]|nr:hypothetical protein [Herminiimonas sp.]